MNDDERFLLWILGSYLEGTNIIRLPSKYLERLLINGEEPFPKLSDLLKLRSELKSVIFGHIKISKDTTNNLIVFKRFIKPEKYVLVFLNLDKNITITNQTNHEFKDLGIKDMSLEIDYSYSHESKFIIKTIEFDKNGYLINQKIPELSAHISTFAYSSELKDLFPDYFKDTNLKK